MDIKEKDPCLQRLTLGKLVMGQEDPNQGHELETEAPEHGQCGPTEMNTYRNKKSKLRKNPLAHMAASLHASLLLCYLGVLS